MALLVSCLSTFLPSNFLAKPLLLKHVKIPPKEGKSNDNRTVNMIQTACRNEEMSWKTLASACLPVSSSKAGDISKLGKCNMLYSSKS